MTTANFPDVCGALHLGTICTILSKAGSTCKSYFPQPLKPMMQIQSCDEILANMEDMLGKFQGNLGNISSEIRALQEQSQGMSVRLKNRKAFEERLGSFLDNIAVSSSLIEGIVNAPVDEQYQAMQPFVAHLCILYLDSTLGIMTMRDAQ